MGIVANALWLVFSMVWSWSSRYLSLHFGVTLTKIESLNFVGSSVIFIHWYGNVYRVYISLWIMNCSHVLVHYGSETRHVVPNAVARGLVQKTTRPKELRIDFTTVSQPHHCGWTIDIQRVFVTPRDKIWQDLWNRRCDPPFRTSEERSLQDRDFRKSGAIRTLGEKAQPRGPPSSSVNLENPMPRSYWTPLWYGPRR